MVRMHRTRVRRASHRLFFFASLTLLVGLALGVANEIDGLQPRFVPAAFALQSTDTVNNRPPRLVTGTVTYLKQVVASDVDETHAVVAADLDGDGDVDIVATDYVDGTIFWYENDGGGGFIAGVVDSLLDGVYPAGLSDVDRDGDSDILAAGYLADTVVWYENDGGGTFTRHDVDSDANGAHSVVAADLDQDDDVDLVTSNQDGGSIDWYENDGNNTFTRHTIDDTAIGAKRAECADIDGDGDLDIVSASFAVDEIAWHENDGDENFVKHVIDGSVDGAYYVSVADADGDADIDIFSASQLDDAVRVYINDGTGIFAGRVLDANAEGVRTVIAIDIDGDGDNDAVAASVDDDTIGLYENDGNGFFSMTPIDEAAPGAYGVFVADLDHDGDLDVLSASRDANMVAVHFRDRLHEVVVPEPGGTLIIDSNRLRAVDPDQPAAEVTYTLIVAPTAGDLLLDGVVVQLGWTFSQADVDENRVSYVHDGAAAVVDELAFLVDDGEASGGSARLKIYTADLSSDLLAHWPLDEISGGMTQDVAGGYDGTLVGGPIWQAEGRIGGALEFDGVDDRVELGPVDGITGRGLTLALWLRPNAFIGDSRLLSKATSTAEQGHYWMVSTFSMTALRFRLRAGGATSTLIGPQGELAVGDWYHVACTYDENEMRIYGNGRLLASLPKAGALDVAPLVQAALGDQPAGAGTNPFAGVIDDARIYSRALSDAEVVALYLLDSRVVTGVPKRVSAHGGPVLDQNIPNPFNPTTTIRYEVPIGSLSAELVIYDVAGRLVATLADGFHAPGEYRVVWDGTNGHGERVATGVYFYRLQTDGRGITRKMVLLQ